MASPLLHKQSTYKPQLISALYFPEICAMNTSDVRVETEIEASADTVWSIISNFSKWSDWHKSGVEVLTNNGVPVLLKTQMSGVPLRINLNKVKIVERRHLEWTGTLPIIGGLLSGVRKFTLSEISESRCELVQEETFSGAISGLVKRKLITSYQHRYNLHNQKIKAIAESKYNKA
jgi:hypothetical protein